MAIQEAKNRAAVRNTGGSRANVAFGSPNCVTGAVFRAPAGTTLPTDNKTKLSSSFIPQGAVSADGVTRDISKAYTEVEGWCGDTIAQKRSSLGVKFTFTLVEVNNPETGKSVFGSDQTVKDGEIVLAYTGADVEPGVWVFDLKDGDKLRRIVVPDAEVTTDSFSNSYKSSELITYPVTLTAYPDADGVYFYEYSQDGTYTSPPPSAPEDEYADRAHAGDHLPAAQSVAAKVASLEAGEPRAHAAPVNSAAREGSTTYPPIVRTVPIVQQGVVRG